jgi:release factor glutamine methyltransferase
VTTINARIAEGRHRLLGAGIDHEESALDARLLAQAVLGWDTARILTSGDELEPSPFAAQYEELISRRAHREPLSYITGTREFWNLSIEVSPAVLIPRPETEGLVEAVNELFQDHQAALRIADVCTGSGCVAVAIASERPNVRVIATDDSAAALEIARRNTVRHAVTDRVQCVRGDLLKPLSGTFDVIVANPPYVPSGARAGLQPEVRDFEPAIALFAGADGLDMIRRLVGESPVHLTPAGYLMFEFGDGQETAVRELISASDRLRMVDVKRDLQGIARIAISSQKRRSETRRSKV